MTAIDETDQRILTMLEADGRATPRATGPGDRTVRLRRPVARAEAGEARHHQGIQGHHRPRAARLAHQRVRQRDPCSTTQPNPRFRTS